MKIGNFSLLNIALSYIQVPIFYIIQDYTGKINDSIMTTMQNMYCTFLEEFSVLRKMADNK